MNISQAIKVSEEALFESKEIGSLNKEMRNLYNLGRYYYQKKKGANVD